MKYTFIYELCYNDKPFYVGISDFPSFRYRQHLYDSLSRPYFFCRYMIYTFNMYPDIKIVCCIDDWFKALDLEQAQIKLRISEGYNLLNNYKVKMPPITMKKKYIPKSIFISLKQGEENAIKTYEQNNN